jgi:hypothetical protein
LIRSEHSTKPNFDEIAAIHPSLKFRRRFRETGVSLSRRTVTLSANQKSHDM